MAEPTDVPVEGQLDANPFEQTVPEGTQGEQMSQEAVPAEGTQEQTTEPEPGTETTPPPTGEQQPQPDTWNADEYALNYRGTRQIPASKEELINLAQKGYSYSQEMEKLKGQRQQLDTEYAKYRQFDDLLKSNPALAQQITQVVQEQANNPGAQQQTQEGQLPPEVLSRINNLEQFSQQQVKREQDMVLDNEIGQIKQKYPNNNWKDLERPLLQFAYDNGISNLDYAYRAMTYDNVGTNARAEALKTQQQNRMNARQQGIVQNGQVAPITPPAQQQTYRHGDSYSELARKMSQAATG